MKLILILAGMKNKQNCRIWGTENPHAYIEKPTQGAAVIGPCWTKRRRLKRRILATFGFIKTALRVTQPNLHLMSCSLFLKIALSAAELMSFGHQHLVLTGRRYVLYSRSYTRCFAPYFWRSHYQPQNWCRLATSKLRIDTVGLLFVECRQRYVLHQNKPEIIDGLKDNNREAIGEMRLQTIDNVLKNWTYRVGFCMASRGIYLNEIIFH